jgi:VanZ family protein
MIMRIFSSPRFLWSVLLVYWILLTNLLLAPRPWWYLGNFESGVQQLVERSLADYIQHLLAFSLLAVFAWGARTSTRRPSVLLLLAGLGLYAILAELLQLWIPGRTYQWLDMACNLAGIALGWSLSALLARPDASGQPN